MYLHEDLVENTEYIEIVAVLQAGAWSNPVGLVLLLVV